MAVVPTGGIALALKNLRTVLSNCTAFQTWTGTASAAAAAERIHYAAEEEDFTLPHAVILFGDESEHTRTAEFGGARNIAFGRQSADVQFTADISATYSAYTTNEDRAVAFLNDIGAILDALWDMAGEGVYLNVVETTKMAGPSWAAKEETYNWLQITYRVVWEGQC